MELFLDQLEGLGDKEKHNAMFGWRYYLLETLSQVKCFVICNDLEGGKDIIRRIFEYVGVGSALPGRSCVRDPCEASRQGSVRVLIAWKGSVRVGCMEKEKPTLIAWKRKHARIVTEWKSETCTLIAWKRKRAR